MAPGDLAYKPLDTASKQLNTPLVQQKDYNITKSEWVADNREQIIKENFASNETRTVYTVPKNKVFFLTHFSHLITSTGAGASNAINSYLWINKSPAVFTSLSRIRIADNLQQSIIDSADLTMPMKVFPGQSIKITSGTNFHNTAVIFGFLEDF